MYRFSCIHYVCVSVKKLVYIYIDRYVCVWDSVVDERKKNYHLLVSNGRTQRLVVSIINKTLSMVKKRKVLILFTALEAKRPSPPPLLLLRRR